jgi:prepilin-type N-terminal cleavage/methylation domain-containing protein
MHPERLARPLIKPPPAPARVPARRQGFSLIELLVALWLLGLIGTLVVALLRTEVRVAGHSADRTEALEAMRTAAAVLAADLLPLDAAADLAGMSVDTAALRVFRGIGIVCGFSGGDALARYRGFRQPEPVKDSVLLVTSVVERADSLQLAVVAPGACAALPGEEVFRIRVARPVTVRDVLLFFETGSYHLDGALRYRRGAGGRQPMSAEVLDARTRFIAHGVDAIGVELVPSVSSGSLRGLPLAPPAWVRVPLRNRP